MEITAAQPVAPTTTSTVAVEESDYTLATLVLAGSVAAGSNLLAVNRGQMEPKTAVSNALIKGVFSSAVLTGFRPTTPLRLAGCMLLLGSVGYGIDYLMKDDFRPEEEAAP